MDETESGNTFEWITANTAGMQNFLQGSRLTKVLHGFVMFYKVLQGSSAVCWMCIIEMRSNPCRTLPFDDSVLQGGPPAVWWGVQEVDPCWQVPSLLLCLPSPGIKQILKQNGESRLGKEGEKKDSEFYENDTLPHVKISVLHPASLAREQGLRAFQVVVGHLCLNKQREKNLGSSLDQIVCSQLGTAIFPIKDTTKGPGVFAPGLIRDVPRVA